MSVQQFAYIATAWRLLNAVTKRMYSQHVAMIMPVLGLQLSCASLTTIAPSAHIMTPSKGAVASVTSLIPEDVPQLQHSIQCDPVLRQLPCRLEDLKRPLLRSQVFTQAGLQSPFMDNMDALSPSHSQTADLFEHSLVISAAVF